jgi:uncharacterized damage-inducible protein DinB
MTIDEARELFAYSAWANGRMLGAAELRQIEVTPPSTDLINYLRSRR